MRTRWGSGRQGAGVQPQAPMEQLIFLFLALDVEGSSPRCWQATLMPGAQGDLGVLGCAKAGEKRQR